MEPNKSSNQEIERDKIGTAILHELGARKSSFTLIDFSMLVDDLSIDRLKAIGRLVESIPFPAASDGDVKLANRLEELLGALEVKCNLGSNSKQLVADVLTRLRSAPAAVPAASEEGSDNGK